MAEENGSATVKAGVEDGLSEAQRIPKNELDTGQETQGPNAVPKSQKGKAAKKAGKQFYWG